jgi:hypothetical protein
VEWGARSIEKNEKEKKIRGASGGWARATIDNVYYNKTKCTYKKKEQAHTHPHLHTRLGKKASRSVAATVKNRPHPRPLYPVPVGRALPARVRVRIRPLALALRVRLLPVHALQLQQSLAPVQAQERSHP